MTSNLVIFSEQGERFTVVLNGVRINDNPETNVKITDLNAPNYKLKIVFDDASIVDMDKNVYVEPGTECTYNVKKNNKGEYVLRMLSQSPLAQAPPPAPGQRTIVYTQVPPNDGIVIRGGTTTMTTTTTTVSDPNVIGANVNVGGVNMNVTVTDGTGAYMTGGTTTTTYSSTTTSTTGYTGGTTVVTESGCIYPMGSTDFSSAKSSISSKSFDDTRLTVAKQIVDANCLTAQQVKEIMLLFSFEDSRLDFAKYAYNKVTDPNNYYKLNDAFTFESNVDELNNYVRSNPRR